MNFVCGEFTILIDVQKSFNKQETKISKVSTMNDFHSGFTAAGCCCCMTKSEKLSRFSDTIIQITESMHAKVNKQCKSA